MEKEDLFLLMRKLFIKNSLQNIYTTILGGCCETRPSHIKAFSKLK